MVFVGRGFDSNRIGKSINIVYDDGREHNTAKGSLYVLCFMHEYYALYGG